MDFDVIIIGSGPSASSAAISCTRYGLKTLIVTDRPEADRNDRAENHAWESIHPGVRSMLLQLDAEGCIDVSKRGIYQGVQINGQLNRLGNAEEEWEGYHINRMAFDDAFLQSAKTQGATVRYNDGIAYVLTNKDRVCGVKTISGATISCAYTIDASGPQRIAGRQLKLKEVFDSPPLITATGLCSLPINSVQIPTGFTHFIPNNQGWTWLAPGDQERCTWTRLAVKGKHDLLPPPELQDALQLAPLKVSNRRWRVFRPVCMEGILLCGDAAGILDPAAGQGILNAILSGAMAAKTVGLCVNDIPLEAFHLARYDDWFITEHNKKVEQLKQLYQELGINILA